MQMTDFRVLGLITSPLFRAQHSPTTFLTAPVLEVNFPVLILEPSRYTTRTWSKQHFGKQKQKQRYKTVYTIILSVKELLIP